MIIPRGKYILVKPDVEESKENEVGLLTPSNEEIEEKAIGTVVSENPEINDIKIGDRVIYGVLAGEVMKKQEEGKEVKYLFLHSDDIIGFEK